MAIRWEPDGGKIRQIELAEATEALNAEQRKLEHMRRESPVAPVIALTDPVDPGRRDECAHDTEHGCARHEAGRARAGMTVQAENVSKALEPMKRFFREQALIASIRSSEIASDLEQIHSGLKTLELYTGKGVDVVTITDGEPADPDEPLHLFQRLLYMDEESLINVAQGGADFADFDEFIELVRSDESILQRIAPMPRCVVAMQYRRHGKDYGGDDVRSVIINSMKNAENRKAFLLVRNGQKLYAVFGSIEYMHRLFPTTDEFDKPFRGYRGETIKPTDLNYPDARSKADRLALYSAS